MWPCSRIHPLISISWNQESIPCTYWQSPRPGMFSTQEVRVYRIFCFDRRPIYGAPTHWPHSVSWISVVFVNLLSCSAKQALRVCFDIFLSPDGLCFVIYIPVARWPLLCFDIFLSPDGLCFVIYIPVARWPLLCYIYSCRQMASVLLCLMQLPQISIRITTACAYMQADLHAWYTQKFRIWAELRDEGSPRSASKQIGNDHSSWVIYSMHAPTRYEIEFAFNRKNC